MIYCITPNPAIDRILALPRLVPGSVLRASREDVIAGGKGVNAARTIHRLGGEAVCMGFLAGYAGQMAASLIEEEGLPAVWTLIEGETRTSTIVIETEAEPSDDGEHAVRRDATVLNTPGPQITVEDWDRLESSVLQHAVSGDTVAFCGSLAPGIPPGRLCQTLLKLAETGCRTWVDTSGSALAAAQQAAPRGIKVNQREMSELVGKDIHTLQQAKAAAHATLEGNTGGQGAISSSDHVGERSVTLTMGAAGALLCQAGSCWQGVPPVVRAVSSVGSGDAFFGALLLGFQQGIPAQDALRSALAAGAANTLVPGSGCFNLEDYLRLLGESRVDVMDME